MKNKESMESVLKKIESIMKRESINVLEIQRKYLPEIFSTDLLKISKNDGLPTIKPSVSEYFRLRGVIINLYDYEVEIVNDRNAPYRIQLGLLNGKWATRLLRGIEVIDTYIFKDEDIQEDIPSQNQLISWLLMTIAIPNINPHKIMKILQPLTKQILEIRNRKKLMPPISETKTKEFEKIIECNLDDLSYEERQKK